MNSIFVSFANKNEEVAKQLVILLRKAGIPEGSVFFTGEPIIDSGDNYNKEIFQHLETSDVFLVLLSREYWESRYCVFELSSAYAKTREWALDSNPNNDFSIKPALIPPLSKSDALSNTPLFYMQVKDITNVNELLSLLKEINPGLTEQNLESLKTAASEFAGQIKKDILMKASLTDDADANVWMDEDARSPVKKSKLISAEQTDGGSYIVKYDFGGIGYDPGFASLALQYMQEINLREYLKADREASFDCRIQCTREVPSVTIEFKDIFTKLIKSFAVDLTEGAAEVSIPLKKLDCDRLEKVSEICFVVHPKEDQILENTMIIDQIKVDLKGKSRLNLDGLE